MKCIINGKKYDTDTARLVCVAENRGVNEFRHERESLYRKRTGEYFIYGEGGPLSQYARSGYGGGWTSGESIRPLTAEEARKWAEGDCSMAIYQTKRGTWVDGGMDVDEYEAEFGEVEE